MCKNTAKTMAGNPGTSQENVNTNIGLLNMSSEEIGGPMSRYKGSVLVHWVPGAGAGASTKIKYEIIEKVNKI